MTDKKGPGAGGAEAREMITSGKKLHINQSPDVFKIAIEYATTADMDDGQPLPPFIEDAVTWCVVRRQRGGTIWRRIILQTTKQLDAVTLDDGMSIQAASPMKGTAK
jgi:hypothetical protein